LNSDDRIPHRVEVNRISYLFIMLARALHGNIFPANEGNFGRDIEAVLVALAVSIGHTEHRPMTSTKIAHYIGMPRTTVLRKLVELKNRGVIVREGNHFCLSQKRLQQVDGDAIFRFARIIGRFTLS
jgi:hypothetical protein